MAQVQPSSSYAPPPPFPSVYVGNSSVAGSGSSGDKLNLASFVSLYVRDLDLKVTDSQLFDYFMTACPVVSVRVCRDVVTNASLGYAYVNFINSEDAEKALNKLNFTSLNGKIIRVTHSSPDSSARRSGIGNLFVKNLDKSVGNKTLHEMFSKCGKIVSCKVATDPMGQSKGHGFVQFESEESAKSANEKLNGKVLKEKEIFAGPFLRKEERGFTNVYVKNLSEMTTYDELKTRFGEYESISSPFVMRDEDGKSRCYEFVNFENPEDAACAVEALNGKKFDEKEWYVGKAQKKYERVIELSRRGSEVNLSVKNLDETVTDDKLREMFAEFGIITSCEVMRDPSGTSRESGFVTFSAATDASRVLNEKNGKIVGAKPLVVATTQKMEERSAKQEEQFPHMIPAFIPDIAPGLPILPVGLGQPIIYGQGPPPIIPHQHGFGNQPQLVPGMRPNFFGPMMHQQGPPGRRSGDGPMRHQPQQPMPFMQPHMIPRGRGNRYPPSRNMHEGPKAVPSAYDICGFPFDQPLPVALLGDNLSNAPPAEQRLLLGESLYPLVDQIQHENGAKVTGMLLELDHSEVLYLLESPEALKTKVLEALDVLRNANKTKQQVIEDKEPPSDRLVSLSINDQL